MRKVLAATMVAAMLITGAAVASAQEATEDEATVTESVTTLADVMQGLVDDGTLTQVQADAVTEALEQHRANRPQRPGKGGMHLEAHLEVLGLTADELATQLQDGATLAEVAGDQVDEVSQLITDQINARIDQGVADGRLDDAKAAELRDGIGEKVDEILNGEVPFGGRGHGRRGPGGPGGEFGPGSGFGPGADDAPAADTSA